MGYARTASQRNFDYLNSKRWEQEVRTWLPDYVDDRTSSTSELDFYVPGAYLDGKEKNQKIGQRWPLPCEEEHAFIIDELSIRKALKHYPAAYFVMRDVPNERVFLARVDEVALAEGVRLNRMGKGKKVVDLRNFRLLDNPEQDLWPAILADQIDMAWKNSECLSALPIKQV